MFKFSFNWLKRVYKKELNIKDTLEILDLQGFEVKGQQDINFDKVITVEVKANRPDILCHRGIAREIRAFRKEPNVLFEGTNIKTVTDNDRFPIKINVKNQNVCDRFSALMLKGVNNNVQTPEYIKDSLTALGINCVNAIVDITNYIMLEYNQPMHAYDADKIDGAQLNISLSDDEKDVYTLFADKVQIGKNDILISDNNKVLCIAGVVGAECSKVEFETSNILLESAVFNPVNVRLTSRRLKISTPSSFRFERGVDAVLSKDILMKCAELIVDICGGTVEEISYDYYTCIKQDNDLQLRVSRVNKVLGTSLTQKEIIQYMNQYYFNCDIIDEDTLNVHCPSYRLDLEKEINLIEEVARIYGYHNIEAKMPVIASSYNHNEVWDNMDTIRNVLVGLGFYETINYSFIPADTMKVFRIDENSRLYSDVLLKNPISQAYALMRPTMAYSLADCLAYNYSKNNYNLALFELGRTYFKDQTKDTGCREIDTLGMIISGTRLGKGWGITKDVKYTYYDIINYLSIIFNEFGMEFSLEKADYKFCVSNTSCDIIVDGKHVGYIGELDKKVIKNVQNIKLVRDGIFYCELYLSALKRKRKTLKFESKYPPIVRQYNLLYKKDVKTSDVINIIKSSNDIVRDVVAEDIYEDKNMESNKHAILFDVTYASDKATLTAEQIEEVEKLFLNQLSTDVGAVIK